MLETDAGVAPATERHGREPRLDVVDPDVAGLDRVRRPGTPGRCPGSRPRRSARTARRSPVAIASSSVAEGHRRQDRPEDLHVGQLVPRPTRVDHGRLEEGPARRARRSSIAWPPVSTARPGAAARSTMSTTRVRAVRVIIAPISVAGSDGIPIRILARPLDDPLEHRLGDRLVDDQAARRAAALALDPRVVHAPDDRRRGLVEVDVGEDHDRVLAAELERHRLHAAAARPPAWIRSAVGVLPVNVIRRIDGGAAIAAPVAGPPTTTLITPSGTIPALSSAIRSGLSGASSTA